MEQPRPDLDRTSTCLTVFVVFSIMMIVLAALPADLLRQRIVVTTEPVSINDPVFVANATHGEQRNDYEVEIKGHTISVGTVDLRWQLTYLGNNSIRGTEYDYYTFSLVERVEGTVAETGAAGWIEKGQTLLDLHSDSTRIKDHTGTHDEGPLRIAVRSSHDWNGSVEWLFFVREWYDSYYGTELSFDIGFRDRGLSSPDASVHGILAFDIVFQSLIVVTHGASLNFTLRATTEWSITGYSFERDRTLVQVTQTLIMDIPSQNLPS